MSIRPKGTTWVVEIYDPATKSKKHVKPSDFGMEESRGRSARQGLLSVRH